MSVYLLDWWCLPCQSVYIRVLVHTCTYVHVKVLTTPRGMTTSVCLISHLRNWFLLPFTLGTQSRLVCVKWRSKHIVLGGNPQSFYIIVEAHSLSLSQTSTLLKLRHSTVSNLIFKMMDLNSQMFQSRIESLTNCLTFHSILLPQLWLIWHKKKLPYCWEKLIFTSSFPCFTEVLLTELLVISFGMYQICMQLSFVLSSGFVKIDDPLFTDFFHVLPLCEIWLIRWLLDFFELLVRNSFTITALRADALLGCKTQDIYIPKNRRTFRVI